jgi:hypothetical protein
MRPKKQSSVVTEYMVGPQPDGIRFCVACRKEFTEGELWLKQTRVGEYSVGIHTACLVKNEATPQGPAAPA